MTKLKVATVVGTRPELIKLSRVIAELERHTEHVLVHTGQNYDYELNQVFFDQLEIRKPHHFLEAAAESAAETVGQVITRSHQVLERESPEALLVLGDTNSCLAAYAAKRLQIPVFHMEAGNRAFDERIPEEINRRLIDHLSDVNLPYTEHARRYLLAEGLPPDRVIKTGSPLGEVLAHYRPRIDRSRILESQGLERDGFYVVSLHREENVDRPERLAGMLAALGELCEAHGLPVVFSTHPRTRKRLEALEGGAEPHPGLRFLDALGFLDFVKLQMEARCVVSDSGSLTEEASLLNLPAVTLRDAHERPEGMDEGTVVMASPGGRRLLQAVELVTAQHSRDTRAFRVADDYRQENVSKKVARIILSYVDYVNARVWCRPG